MSDELDTTAIRGLMPFAAHLGLEIVEATPRRVVATMAWADALCTAGGVLHGGAVMGMADSVGGTVAFLNLPTGAATSTISSSTVFLRAVRDGALTAIGRPIHVGRSTIVVETEVTQGDRVVARTTQAQAVLGPKPG